MNSFHLARNLSRRSQTVVFSRFFSKGGAIPTSSTAEVGGVKVVGLPHLSVRCDNVQLEPHTSSMRWAERKKNWLSNPETYPLIGILAGAGVFVSGFITYFLVTAPDVQISPIKR
ncbi:hypothetical protein ACHAW5_006259 [Stephanodiscus triporus]|uniref:Deltamethrin resistance protein prag01 domain-containing protein n=1 Tax=Stephanodiscus triporus TaxID=2934178 RepID=A0ABD3MLW6_9STRA